VVMRTMIYGVVMGVAPGFLSTLFKRNTVGELPSRL